MTHHAPLPTSGRALDGVALNATLHCLTGCAIGEIVGMLVGTALGFTNWGTVALSVALAFVFGYSLTSLPLLRAGLAIAAVVPIALATDTFSIATMEVIDNAVMLVVPGAMDAGLGDILFWGSLSFSLVLAGGRRLPGQPLADHAGQGPRGAARDRHPRRPRPARGGGVRGRGRRVRHRGAGRRGSELGSRAWKRSTSCWPTTMPSPVPGPTSTSTSGPAGS